MGTQAEDRLITFLLDEIRDARDASRAMAGQGVEQANVIKRFADELERNRVLIGENRVLIHDLTKEARENGERAAKYETAGVRIADLVRRNGEMALSGMHRADENELRSLLRLPLRLKRKEEE